MNQPELPRLRLLNDRLAVCRLAPDAPFPEKSLQSRFSAVVRTPDELSIVCEEGWAPEGGRIERGWRAIMVEGPLDFSLTGVLAGIATPLADAGISIFAVSTYDTDYILVREKSVGSAESALREAGYHFTGCKE